MARLDLASLVRLGAAGIGAAMLGACADPATLESAGASTQTAGRQCFLPRQVNGFNSFDRDTVYVTVGVRQVYRLEIVGTCPEVDWSQRIGIRSRGGGSWVCQGLDAELIVPSPTGTQRCPVTAVQRLSEEEVRAYRESRRRRR